MGPDAHDAPALLDSGGRVEEMEGPDAHDTLALLASGKFCPS